MKYMSSIDATGEKRVAKQYKAQTAPQWWIQEEGSGGDSSLRQQHFSKFSGKFDKFQAMDQFLGARSLKTSVWIHPAAQC